MTYRIAYTAPQVGWYRERNEMIYSQRHNQLMTIEEIANCWHIGVSAVKKILTSEAEKRSNVKL